VLPDVPTLIEQGLKETSIVAYGLTAPAKTDATIVARLRQTISEMMKDPAVTEQLTKLGFELRPLIGDQYRDFIMKDLERWRAVAKVANIRIEN
jgi:tripartite-type tricarboxylate transporter receptor subunit TctC